MKVRELEISYGRVISDIDGRKVTSPEVVADVLRDFIGDAPEERFVVVYLDSRHRATSVQEISRGTINASLVHPREVFRGAILNNSAAIVIAHNHPSGDSEPSPEDREVTERLVSAGKLLGIRVLDHVIIGDENYSFNANGEMGN